MNFTEEEGEPIQTVDISTLVPKKGKGKGKKAAVKAVPTSESAESADPVEKLATEKDKLKSELLRLSDYHPEIVTKPINDKIAKLVEEMSLEELRERVRYGKRNQSSKMDETVASQTILMANQVAGRMLGCLEELNETSMKDKLLNECIKDYLCMNILDYIPNELKITGLYGSHITSAYYKAGLKKTPQVNEVLDDPEVDFEKTANEDETRDEIKRAIANHPGIQSKMEDIKSKLGALII